MAIDPTGLSQCQPHCRVFCCPIPYHNIATLGIDHLLRAVDIQHSRRSQQHDLPILDSDIVIRDIRCGHYEPVDDEKVEAIHNDGLAPRSQRGQCNPRDEIMVALPRPAKSSRSFVGCYQGCLFTSIKHSVGDLWSRRRAACSLIRIALISAPAQSSLAYWRPSPDSPHRPTPIPHHVSASPMPLCPCLQCFQVHRKNKQNQHLDQTPTWRLCLW